MSGKSKLNSPFSHLLATNYVPSDTEARQIEDLLSQPVRDLARLDAEIAHLQSIIDGLTHERDEVNSYVTTHRAFLSPARRLPPEVVGDIFMHCLPSNRNPTRSVTEAPLLLGRVCSKWRDISISTPRLWSSFHVVIPSYFDASKNIAVARTRSELMKVWFGRSGILPLSISLVASDMDTPISPLLDCLLQFSRRWKHLDLKVPRSVLNVLDGLTGEDIPLLEAIEIDDGWNEPSDLRILGKAPRLHVVSFIRSQANPLSLTIPWARLTHLSLCTGSPASCLDAKEALETLRRCPDLRDCALGICSSPLSGFIPPSVVVTLPALRTLRLVACSERPVSLRDVFEHLVMLGLLELEVVGNINDGPVPEPHVPFISILTPSPCSIERLAISHLAISQEALFECLQLVPSLIALKIRDWPQAFMLSSKPNLDDQFLDRLTPSGSPSSCLCPRLRIVKFRCAIFSDEALLKFIHSRRLPLEPGIPCLQTVRISLDRLFAVDIMPQIQKLSAQGLICSVVCRHKPPEYFDSPWEGIDVDTSD